LQDWLDGQKESLENKRKADRERFIRDRGLKENAIIAEDGEFDCVLGMDRDEHGRWVSRFDPTPFYAASKLCFSHENEHGSNRKSKQK
jgi:hypothetical protein